MRVHVSLLALFTALTLNAQARTEIRTNDDFGAIVAEISRLQGSHRAEDVLVVFDIDKTLMIVQNCLPPKESKGLSGWMKMANKCPADLTEAQVPARIRDLQNLGFATIALTARPAILTAATERELDRNGIVFAGHPFDTRANFAAPFPNGQDLIFKDGVTYAGGRDKGISLQEFQRHQSRPYRQVVFVDDDRKNIRHMDQAYTADPQVDVRIYHYNRYK